MFCLQFIACKKNTKQKVFSDAGQIQPILYARGFSILRFPAYTKITVHDPLDAKKIFAEYFLIKKGSTIPDWMQEKNYFEVPLQSIACISTTHLGFIEALHLENKITGFSGTEYIYDSLVNALVQNGAIKEIGNTEGEINYELLAQISPDGFMAYHYGNSMEQMFNKLSTLNIKTIVNNEFLETSPLGQAEWIKFVALFFDESASADSIFNIIVSQYDSIKNLALEIRNKPTVFSGLPFKGEWTVPGGKSFAATYIKDAGGKFLWADNDKTGNYPLAMEEIILKASQAEIWLNAGAAESLHDISLADKRLINFNAWKNGNVYNNNQRTNLHGGNDYWESAVVSPHLVLADLFHIFHPDDLHPHEFYYYKKLN